MSKTKPNSESNTKLWGGRFKELTADIMNRIGESISFDKELYSQDIRGSLAHAQMLCKIGILSNKELTSIEKGLQKIQIEIETGKFEYKMELEDIHMHIESRLTQLIGEAGKKLHTARSRNDQVSQDVRLYILDQISLIENELILLLEQLLLKARSSIDVLFPGYTHLQIAQPIRASHYFMAHFWAFLRDLELFQYVKETTDLLVLGSGAMAGVNYNSDREFLRKELKLSRISENSMDAVSQRDHIIQYLFAISQCMTHASRVCEEFIIYSSTEFNYIGLPDRLTSGSSIMPQKKNPDVAELIRGKSAMVFGNLMSLLSLVKGTPMAYNRDFQEDKIPMFQSSKHILLSLEGLREMVSGLEIKSSSIEENLKKGFSTATDLADWLVSFKKIPFREAHEIVGNLVSFCTENKLDLFNVSLEDRSRISIHLTDSSYLDSISLYKSADKKNVAGGTARKRQLEQFAQAEKRLKFYRNKRNSKLKKKPISKGQTK
jgi:argininosuccinate lyase